MLSLRRRLAGWLLNQRPSELSEPRAYDQWCKDVVAVARAYCEGSAHVTELEFCRACGLVDPNEPSKELT